MDEQLVHRLTEAAPQVFEGEPVMFAYLFGSMATGRTHARSDVDVAVYVEPSEAGERYLDLRLTLASRLATSARVGDVEIAVLNELPLPVRGRVVRDRVVIYSRDEPARVRFESETLRQFFDFEIHARPLDQKFLRDTAAGRR